MKFLWIALGVILFIIAVTFALAYVCFRLAFYVKRSKTVSDDMFEMPGGEIYEPFKESMENWAKETRGMPHEEFSITSFDGLKLHGKYYECKQGAPIELMFHGYRGSAQRDLSGGVQRCFTLGRNALIVDQRCSGKSDGTVITFGVNEHKD